MSRVTIAFPPLVETNFGAYYPATAYLAAHLVARGHAVRQLDLNEAFAFWLTDPARLTALGHGGLDAWGERGQRDTAATAARVLQRNRHALFDEEGRHMFVDRPGTPGYLLQWLGAAFRTDLPVGDTAILVADGDLRADFWQRFSVEHLARLPDRDAPHLFGISIAMGPQLLPALALAKAASEVWPQTRTVLGGPAISLMDGADLFSLFRVCPFIDAAVRFDGEKPLAALADQVASNAWHPSAVPGVTAPAADGSILTCPPSAGPVLADLPDALYQSDLIEQIADPVLGVIQARGCYWGQCAYCDFIELYEGSAKFRQRPVRRLVDEISTHRSDVDARRFSLITEALPPSYARRFAETLRERRIEVAWSSFAMVHDRFDLPLMRFLAESGCERLIVGLETMNDRVLSHVGKHAGAEANEAFLSAAAEAGIALTVNLIPDLPSTTSEEALSALERLSEFSRGIDAVSVFPFEATRSSAIGRDPVRYGLEPGGSTATQAQFAGNSLGWSDPAMSASQRKEVHARYFEFARVINTREEPPGRTQLERSVVDLNAVDIVMANTDAHIFDWRRRDWAVVPRELANLVGSLLDGQVIDRSVLEASVGAGRANAFVDILDQTGILRPAPCSNSA